MSRIRHVARRPVNRPSGFFVEIAGFAGLVGAAIWDWRLKMTVVRLLTPA